ncbi:MAG: GNAT family N-acetyltransferase [Bariatricus sp.]
MIIKRLENEEILEGLHLVWDVFAADIAPSYSREGVEEFQRFIKYENFMPKVQSGQLIVFGAREGQELCGVGAVQNDGHIALLFVGKKWQRRGIGRLLFIALQQFCIVAFGMTKMTVNAAPQAEGFYRRLGFQEVAPEQMKNGICYLPMERAMSAEELRLQKKAKRRGKFLMLSILALVVLLGVGVGTTAYRVYTLFQDRVLDGDGMENPFMGGDTQTEKGEEETQKEAGVGIEGIECYQAENLPYTITEESYSYESSKSEGSITSQFDVKYPQIQGLEGEQIAKINEELKNCAMSTVNALYLKASDDMKEAVMKEESPILASKVTYRVTYAGEDFISVVFSDDYYAGNKNARYQDLRTRNIRLSDGKIYETNEIVSLDTEFIKELKKRMKEEAPDSIVVDALKTSQYRKILEGEILDNRYYDNFFVDKDGIEIGMTYHYRDDEQQREERGWITAPFTMEEIKAYKTDSDFWNLCTN